uniref:Uncharacterized protein n=1 Tax=Erythrolobus australicus TaxID=1077150 RepID=A0A7S1XJ12_9RHOD|mmetsp:Transcript_3538/g.9765  ORF Transcript_3538/g.9765 Transcript_3538/m.9765 type:complete len:436 (+) Transcript_3538:2117-3424(+)
MSAFLASIAADDDALARFLESGEQEMNILEKENHPNIPDSVRDFDVNVNQLNAELSSFGVKASLISPGDGIYAEKAFIVAVDTLTNLMKHHRSAIARAEQFEEKLQRAKQEVLYLSKQNSSMDQNNKRLEAALASAELNGRAAQSAADDVRQKLQREVQELKTQLQPLQQRDKYYTSEMRKKDREMERLQKQLNGVLFDKRRVARPTMHTERDGFQLEQARSVNSNEAERFCQMVSRTYEQRNAELLAENDELREAVHQAQRCLRGEIEKISTVSHSSASEVNSPLQPRACQTPNTPCMELLPMQMVRSAVRASLQRKIEQLALRTAAAEHHVSYASAHSDGSEADAHELRAQLEHYKDLVEAQRQLIHEAVPGMTPSGARNRDESTGFPRVSSHSRRRSATPLCTPDVRATLAAQLDAQLSCSPLPTVPSTDEH